IKQIDFVYLSAKDVVRHPVVAEIIKAYEHSTEMAHHHFSKEEKSSLTNSKIVGEPAKESEDDEGLSLD
ncbi:MAG: phosphate starvation-inducible protein PhoH, partial [Streptococcus gordonii]